MKEAEIKTYYDQLAKQYDQDRFNHSYGRFIHAQELDILNQYLKTTEKEQCIDLACGTGRFTSFCHTGIDLSPEMIEVAKAKFPDRQFHVANVLDTGLPADSFQAAICFHLIMHLDPIDLKQVLKETHRMLKRGGIFIFDLPSKERRKWSKSNQSGWHGANSYTQAEVNTLLQGEWDIISEIGILMLPIHHFPKSIRRVFFKIDSSLNRTFLKKYASYRVYIARKK